MDQKAEARVRGFTLAVDNESEPSATSEATNQTDPAGLSLLTLALKTMGQRALIALDNLFTLVTVCLAFYLWHSIENPNILQVVQLGLFGLFVLAANIIVRRSNWTAGGWKR